MTIKVSPRATLLSALEASPRRRRNGDTLWVVEGDCFSAESAPRTYAEALRDILCAPARGAHLGASDKHLVDIIV